MTAPSLAEALDAYAHAIACGAESIIKADRFADLTQAHTEHVAAADLQEWEAARHFLDHNTRSNP